MTRLAMTLLVVFMFGACRDGYDFSTKAIYDAPQGQCRVQISAHGTVAGGADVSADGSAAGTIVRLERAAPSRPLRVERNDGWLELNGHRATQDKLAALQKAAAEASCSLDGAELDEMLKAIENVTSGPKGTLMDGQTKAIVAVSTQFER